MSNSKVIDVTIMGRKFNIACAEDEQEDLLQSVAYLDRKMQDIRDGGKVTGSEQVAIMAALNITHELLTMRIRGSFDMGEFKSRIGRMHDALDSVMPEQDRLF